MKTIELTDEIRDEEPVGYLVFCHDQTVYEYKVFADDREAKTFAENQRDSSDAGEWPIYPLYATHPVYQ